jgi:hypothetical protein
MFKQLINKIKCMEATARICMFGPDKDELKGFIARQIHDKVLLEPGTWTCTHVENMFGEKARLWYEEELIQYTGLRSTSIPFTNLAIKSGRTCEQERLLFTEVLKRKYP